MDYGRRERRGSYGGGYGRREGGRSFGPGFPPKPVEIGKEYDVEITEASKRGEGIARIKGLVVFVPNTKPGDKVKVRITRISRRFCEAEVVGAGEPKAEEEASEATAEEETSEATTEEETETVTESSTETDTETDTEGDTESDTETM